MKLKKRTTTIESARDINTDHRLALSRMFQAVEETNLYFEPEPLPPKSLEIFVLGYKDQHMPFAGRILSKAIANSFCGGYNNFYFPLIPKNWVLQELTGEDDNRLKITIDESHARELGYKCINTDFVVKKSTTPFIGEKTINSKFMIGESTKPVNIGREAKDSLFHIPRAGENLGNEASNSIFHVDYCANYALRSASNCELYATTIGPSALHGASECIAKANTIKAYGLHYSWNCEVTVEEVTYAHRFGKYGYHNRIFTTSSELVETLDKWAWLDETNEITLLPRLDDD